MLPLYESKQISMVKAFIRYISVVICPLSYINAMGENMQFRHFTIDDGLSSNTVFSIEQDKTGFIWAGTREALNRFDGKHFKMLIILLNLLYEKKILSISLVSDDMCFCQRRLC